MDETKKGLSACGASESTVARDEKAGGETMNESMDCGVQVHTEVTFSEELDGEGGACNGKDVMVEVLGSDLYIDGVCTSRSGAELNAAVSCGGATAGVEVLDKDVKPAGVGSGTDARCEGSQRVGSEGVRSENTAVELDGVVSEREESGRAVVGSDEFDVASMQRESVLDNRAQKEVGNGATDASSAGNTACGENEVTSVDHVNSLDAEVMDQNETITRCVDALGCSVIVSSVRGENVQSESADKDDQQHSKLAEHGATEDENNVNMKTLDEQKNNDLQSYKMLEDEGFDKVEFVEKINSVEEQPMENDDIVVGAEVSGDRVLLNSEEKQCSRFEKCTEKERVTDTSQASSDTGQRVDVDEVVGGVSALRDSCSTKKVKLNKDDSVLEQCSLHKGVEMEVDDQPETERIEMINHAAEAKGTSASSSVSEKNLDANAISRIDKEDTQIDGKENFHDESNIRQNVEVQAGISEQGASNGDQKIEIEELNDAEQRKTTDGKVMKRASTKSVSSEINHQEGYLLPVEKESEFCVSDMVWGKVRSHPWWPGQIFHPSDSSEKAMKHYKKDCYLVAYFGDRTFAWNEASQLKPFRKHFSSIEKHSTSESFQNAVDCALDEVTRRVEFGLACPCIPKDTYDTLKYQTVENAGIREELCARHGVDKSLNSSSFAPDKLLEYVKTLSVLPTDGFDRLELVIAKAQLRAFHRFKGYSSLPELQYCGGFEDVDIAIHDGEKNLSEINEHATPVSKNDGQTGPGNLKSQTSSRHKRKHNLKDNMHPTKKERSLSELMGGTPDSPDGDYWSDEKVADDMVLPALSKKRKSSDHFADDSGRQDRRKTISLAKVSSTPKSSFKIGECIRRVASQLTGSPSMSKSSSEKLQKTDGSPDGISGSGSDVPFQNFEEAQRSSVTIPTEYSSLEDLLSSLKCVAQETLGDYSSLIGIVSFFSDFRNSVVVADDFVKEIFSTEKVGNKRKKQPISGSPEAFEFEDMSDTYWTDRVVDNGSEEQPPEEKPLRKNRKKDYQHVPAEPGKAVQVNHRSNSRKRYSDDNHAEVPEKPLGYIDENAPAELVMNFAELDSVPSETTLNKMFRRFGPLKESETEVDRVSSRARVVFKKCADAEAAFSSAKNFNIFGSTPVNYQLNYTPSALFKASSVATTQDEEMHLDLSNYEVNVA